LDAGERALFMDGARALSVLCPWMSIELAVALQPGEEGAGMVAWEERELGPRVRVLTTEDA
jgi:hypothetical protein